MSTLARSWREIETPFIDRLRARYENEGFTFTAPPDAAQLPDFLGSYIPDALAQKPGRNLAIEVRQRQSPTRERALKDIRRLFDGQADWQFHIVLMGTDPRESMTIPAASLEVIRNGVNEVRALMDQGPRPAFIIAWSLLEAAFRAVADKTAGGPVMPGTLVQGLAMNGYIEPETEQRMRALIDLRNRIVHGDLAAEPTTADIELVLSTIEETLHVDPN